MQAVKARTEGTTTVEVHPADSIEQVRARLQQLEGIPPDQVRLVFKGLTGKEQAPFRSLLEEKREAAIRSREAKRVKEVKAAIKISRGIKRLRNTKPARKLLQTMKNEKVRSNAAAKAAAEESRRARNTNQAAAKKAEKIAKLLELQKLQQQQADALKEEEERLQTLLNNTNTVSAVTPVRSTPAGEDVRADATVNRALEALQRASVFGDSKVVPVVLGTSKHNSEPRFTELEPTPGGPGGSDVLHLFKKETSPTHTLHTATAAPPPPPPGGPGFTFARLLPRWPGHGGPPHVPQRADPPQAAAATATAAPDRPPPNGAPASLRLRQRAPPGSWSTNSGFIKNSHLYKGAQMLNGQASGKLTGAKPTGSPAAAAARRAAGAGEGGGTRRRRTRHRGTRRH